MTNDSRKGWKYKRDTDANYRARREPENRNRVERYRERTKKTAKCASRARSRHAGPLEVHHQGGLKPTARLSWMCRKHNREDAGIYTGKYQAGKKPTRAKRRPFWRRLLGL